MRDATLVREDGREGDVFALIGPKKADVPWKVMERQGWIASASCTEIRVPMTDALRRRYALADARDRFRIASENPLKEEAVRRILADHAGEPTLILSMYLEQIRELARSLGIPVLTGSTPQKSTSASRARPGTICHTRFSDAFVSSGKRRLGASSVQLRPKSSLLRSVAPQCMLSGPAQTRCRPSRPS